MGQKLGLKIILALILSILVTVTALTFIAVNSTRKYVKEILLGVTNSYVSSMETEFEWQASRISKMHEAIQFANSGGTVDTDVVSEIFEQQKESDGDFGAIFDSSGNVVWQTDSFVQSDFDSSQLNTSYTGIISSKSGPALMSVDVLSDNSICVLGMRMDSNVWLDELKEETGIEYSVFNGKTRYATTVTNEAGNRSVGTDMSDEIAEQVIKNGNDYCGEANIFGQKYYVAYRPLRDINGNVVGALFSGVSSANSDESTSKMTLIMVIAAAAFGAAAIIVSSLILIRIVIKPIFSSISVGVGIANNLSRGILTNPSDGQELPDDEMGNFVKRLRITTAGLEKYLNDMKQVLSSMAAGDFTVKAQVNYIGDFTEINRSFEKISVGMSDIIGSINDSSKNVFNGSSDISDGSRLLAEGSTRQAAAIQELSASLNDVTEKIRKTAENAAGAGEISRNTAAKIAEQNVEMENMLTAMSEIEKKSDEIKKIIKAIDDIAFQTNILALNAAVESARAGEAGKGFSVVAGEVRSLAAKSAESARQTDKLISDTISAVQKGNLIAKQAAETMKEVTEFTNETNKYISDIAAASSDEAISIEQIKTGIGEISSVVQQNSATAEETASACESLNNEASNLESRIEALKVDRK